MAKIDLDSLSIEELAALREHATDKLFEKVAARRAELEAELEKLAQYGKPVKKAEARACQHKVKKTEEPREPKEPVAKQPRGAHNGPHQRRCRHCRCIRSERQCYK